MFFCVLTSVMWEEVERRERWGSLAVQLVAGQELVLFKQIHVYVSYHISPPLHSSTTEQITDSLSITMWLLVNAISFYITMHISGGYSLKWPSSPNVTVGKWSHWYTVFSSLNQGKTILWRRRCQHLQIHSFLVC